MFARPNQSDLLSVITPAFDAVANTPDDPQEFSELLEQLYQTARGYHAKESADTQWDAEISPDELAAAHLMRDLHNDNKQIRHSKPFKNGENRPYWHHPVQAWFLSLMIQESLTVRVSTLFHDIYEDCEQEGREKVLHFLKQRPLLNTERIDTLISRVTDSKEEKERYKRGREEGTKYSEVKHVGQVRKLIAYEDPAATRMKIYDRTSNFYDWPEDETIRADSRTQHEANNSCEFFVIAKDQIAENGAFTLYKSQQAIIRKIEGLYDVFTHYASTAAKTRNFGEKEGYSEHPPVLHGDETDDAPARLQRTIDAIQKYYPDDKTNISLT